MRVERGQVYYLRYDDSYGYEQAVGRPVLVVSNQDEIDKRNTVVVLLMTTKLNSNCHHVKLTFNNKISYVLCDQFRTVDKARLTTHMGKLDDKDLVRVRGAMLYVLSLAGVMNKGLLEEERKESVPENSSVDEIQARVESELYQKLYMKAMTDLVEARYNLDELQLKYDRIKRRSYDCEMTTAVKGMVAAEKVIDVVSDEPIDIDVVDLKEKMLAPKTGELVEPVGRDEAVPKKLGKSTGVTKKKVEPKVVTDVKRGGRPPVSGKYCRPKREDLMDYWHEGKANVNEDSWETILAITGMACDTAREIVTYRKRYGKYVDLVDLLNLTRFGSRCMDKYGHMLEV